MKNKVDVKNMFNIVAIPRRFVHMDWGGVETYVLETGKRIQGLGHHFEVLCPSILTDKFQEVIDGVPVTRTPYFYPYLGLNSNARYHLDKVGGNIFSFSMIRTLNNIPKIDIIHLHTGKRLGGIARMIAKRRNIPYVVTIHGGHFDLPESELRAMITSTKGAFEWGKILGWWVGSRLVLDDASAILCIGQKEKEEVLLRYPNKLVEYMPNGVDVKRFSIGNGKRFRNAYKIQENARLLVTVARIAPPKNQMLLVKALPALINKNPDVHVAFVGSINDTEYHSEILKLAESLGVSKALTIVPGLQPEDPLLVDAYHAADVFVLPSVHEPFGIVVLEAWSAGRPVIASRVGGIPDFVNDNVNGLLFESNNIFDFLRVYDLLSPETSQSIVSAAREKVIQYDWDNITNKLIELYYKVIKDYNFFLKS